MGAVRLLALLALLALIAAAAGCSQSAACRRQRPGVDRGYGPVSHGPGGRADRAGEGLGH